MGQGTYYCCACSNRVTSAELERGEAYYIDDNVSCGECIEELIADLPAKDQQRILYQHQKPRRPSGTVPVQKGTAARSRGTDRITRGTERVARGTERVSRSAPERSATGRVTTRRTGTLKKSQTGSVPRATERTRKTGAVPRATDRMRRADGDEGDEFAEGGGRKKVLLLAVGGGGVLLVLVVVLLVLLLGGGEEAKEPEPVAGPQPVAPKETESPEVRARNILREAVAFQQKNPDDMSGQLAKFREAVEAAKDTAWADPAAERLRDLTKRLKVESERIIGNTLSNFQNEEFQAVLTVLEEALARHDVEEWRGPFETRLAEVRDAVESRYTQLEKDALAAHKAGRVDEVEEHKARLYKWDIDSYKDKLKKLLEGTEAGAAVAAAPGTPAAPAADANAPEPEEKEKKELTAAVKAYRSAFETAMADVFGRRYDQALSKLKKARDDAGDDDAKKEAEADLKAVAQVRDLRTRALEAVSKLRRGVSVSLRYEDFPHEYKELTGRVLRADAQRLTLKAKESDKEDAKEVTAFVELDAIRGSSLAELALKRIKNLSAADRKACGLLSLAEGEAKVAEGILGGKRGAPGRWFDWAEAALEKSPKPDRTEFLARRLFHRAGVEWEKVATWGPAIEKYRSLKNDFAITKIVRDNIQLILRRQAVGREYEFFPRDFEISGEFRRAKVDPGKTEGLVVEVVRNPEDVEEYKFQQNFVEIAFYALPETRYKAWMYAGACCRETFACLYQSSEVTIRDGGDEFQLEPGSDFAFDLPHRNTRLKKQHKLCKADKQASVWDWIEIPTPRGGEYAGAGAKRMRIYNIHKNFSVAYFVVSAERKRVPSKDETKALAERLANAPPEEKETPGSAAPDRWFLVGPFDKKLDTAFGPEKQDFDSNAEFTGKGKKKFKWQLKDASMKGGSAVFDLAPVFTPNTDVVVYALIHVFSPEDQDALLIYGADDKSKVLLNGKQVHKQAGGGGYKVDEHSVKISLAEGWNRLLIKVLQEKGGFAVAARITGTDKKPLPGVLFDPFGE